MFPETIHKFVLFLLFTFYQQTSFSQFATVNPEVSNILYAGIENPISAVAENTSCDDLILKTTFGKITGKDCRFIYTIDFDSIVKPTDIYTSIEVYKNTKKGLKLLATWNFTIQKLPNPVACISTCGQYEISKSYFRKRGINDGHHQPPSIRAEVPLIVQSQNLRLNYRFIIDKFNFSIFRKDSCLINSMLNEGNYFTDLTYEAFKVLQKDDKIVFDKVYSKGSDGSRRLLSSFTVTITD